MNALRAPDERGVGAQHARADRVERADPHPGGLAAEEAADAVAHLARGLVGEGHGEDLIGADDAVADEARDRAVSTRVLPDPAPASTSSGPDAVLHRLALGVIQGRVPRARCFWPGGDAIMTES